MNAFKKLIKAIVGRTIVGWYHQLLAVSASAIYGNPSSKLVVIGVTGTNGKSTTVNLIAKILEASGHKVAFTSTVNFKIADKEWLSDLKMTMPGRFFLQKFLADAVKQGCQYAVLETSSEGISQFRHVGIHYDAAVFTNLTPEHLEAHGGFENYKKAKLKLFEHLQALPQKMIEGKLVPKIIAANIDDPAGSEFSNFKVDEVVTFGQNLSAKIRGEDFKPNPDGISFRVGKTNFSLKLLGIFDFYNSLAAIATTTALGVGLDVCESALEKTETIPGRMEIIKSDRFNVLIDYAPEPESLRQMYQTIDSWPKQRIIHILGSTGGGRDRSRRQVLGQLAGQRADVVIVTNEDPYDDDPMEIINEVAAGASSVGKILDKNLFKEIDRRKAVQLALSMAGPEDLVVITGKGSEQKMAVAGGYVPWDDRKVVAEELAKIKL